MNTLGAGAWLVGVFCAKASHAGAFGLLDGGDQQFLTAAACTITGAVILLWANLRSPA